MWALGARRVQTWRAPGETMSKILIRMNYEPNCSPKRDILDLQPLLMMNGGGGPIRWPYSSAYRYIPKRCLVISKEAPRLSLPRGLIESRHTHSWIRGILWWTCCCEITFCDWLESLISTNRHTVIKSTAKWAVLIEWDEIMSVTHFKEPIMSWSTPERKEGRKGLSPIHHSTTIEPCILY